MCFHGPFTVIHGDSRSIHAPHRSKISQVNISKYMIHRSMFCKIVYFFLSCLWLFQSNQELLYDAVALYGTHAPLVDIKSFLELWSETVCPHFRFQKGLDIFESRVAPIVRCLSHWMGNQFVYLSQKIPRVFAQYAIVFFHCTV